MKVIPLHNNIEQLIKRAVKNDREAQHRLFGLMSPKMLSVCRYYISDLQYAEEVMLNGFFKVFTSLKSFQGKGSFEGWVRTIMVREAISFIRQQKKIEYPTETGQIPNSETVTIEADLNLVDLQKLIDNLPEGYKMVFVMYAIEGYKHHEIAKILEISEGTSKSQLFKARKMLQEQLKTINNVGHGTN